MTGEPRRRRIAVIGGGITGLAAANRLLELTPKSDVTLLESSDRLGGVIRTERCGDYLVEHGADMFTTREPWGIDLCRRLGIDGQLINTNPRHARAFIVHRGRLCPVPDGFALMTPGKGWPIAVSPLLSIAGKLRMAWEYFVPARTDSTDESLETFVTRRLGRQAYERLVQPLIGGIYTADPTKLSMQAALPQFVEMERVHGGLLKGVRNSRTRTSEPTTKTAGARYGMFLTPRDGMQCLVDALATRLSESKVRLNAAVDSLSPNAGGWTLQLNGTDHKGDSSTGRSEDFDAVLVATPAYRAGNLLAKADSELATQLLGIEYASASIVVLGYRRDQIQHPLDGFGLVVPQIEQRRILAASFASVKFPGRAPDGRVLIRVFVGGACHPELADLPDSELTQLATDELAQLLSVSGAPELSKIVRWRRAMPQYHVGHLERVARIEQRLTNLPTLALAGNAYRGVGIPFCIRSGEEAAEKLIRIDSLSP